jgi:dihydroorotate dehydrogenase (NAD+) catalytic subunit
MTDLSVTIPAGRPLRMKNPIMTASGTFGYGLEFMPNGDLARLGAIIVKGLSLLPRAGNPMPRIAETACGMLNAVGLQNDGVETFVRHKLPALPWREVPVIANIYAASVQEFGELAARLAGQEELAALEVNISCPNVREGGVLFGQNASQAAAVTAAVRARAGDLPVIVKLSPNVTDIAAIARAVEDAGAHAVSCINTLQGMAVDLSSRRPRLATGIGGLSGPAIKPVALRCVRQVSLAVSIPVIGVGGIVTAEDALEFLLVGAHAVQIGTASFIRPDAAFACAADLPAACARHAITDLAEWRGSLRGWSR